MPITNPVITCTRRLEFDAAHRVPLHEHKCRYLHGHRYVVEATFAAEELDAAGRVIDFGIVRERLGTWLDTQWDHTAILCESDRALGEAVSAITGQRIFYLKAAPTAEVMAVYLLENVCTQLFTETGIRCVGVRIWETPNCRADAGYDV